MHSLISSFLPLTKDLQHSHHCEWLELVLPQSPLIVTSSFMLPWSSNIFVQEKERIVSLHANAPF
jgi:hypothetical protein